MYRNIYRCPSTALQAPSSPTPNRPPLALFWLLPIPDDLRRDTVYRTCIDPLFFCLRGRGRGTGDRGGTGPLQEHVQPTLRAEPAEAASHR